MNLQELQRRNQELAILNTIAQNLNREPELELALDDALQQVIQLLGLQTGWIWLFNPPTQNAYLAAAHNLPPIFDERPELLAGTCYCIKKYLTGNLDDASNISEITCTRLEDLNEGTSGLRYHASIPLFSQDQKMGILNVLSSDSQELAEEQLRLLYTIGDMISIAIDRSRLFANSRQAGIIEERNRLAREIHDTLAQSLAAISLRLESLDILLEQGVDTPKLQPPLRATLDLVHHSLEEARRSVLDLRASPLEESNLPLALEKLVQEVKASTSSRGHCQVQGQYRRLSQRVEMGLYRIAQEALHNIRQHAQAKKFSLLIEYTPQMLRLYINDNGQGFDPEAEVQGFGLIGISERAKLLGAQLAIQSQIGEGTHLTLHLPIDSNEPTH